MATSQHFSDNELRCPHCGINMTTKALVDALEALRSLISTIRGKDTPIYIDSAYRCVHYNSLVPHAALHSQHELGTAADIRVKGATAMQLYEWALGVEAFRNGGIGRSDFANYVHVDVRPDGSARWCYDAQGAVAPWEDQDMHMSQGPVSV